MTELLGGIKFISQDEYRNLGYTRPIHKYPVLVYGDDTSDTINFINLYTKDETIIDQSAEQYKIIPSYLIKEFIDLDVLEQIHPELFL